MDIVDESKQYFLKMFEEGKDKAYAFLPRHVRDVEKWAGKLVAKYPEADKEILFVAVWFHDIGQTIGEPKQDHAVKSESELREFLASRKYDANKIEAIAHCVRAHRNKDMPPNSLEAKILAAADSASHFTDFNYIVHLKDPELGKEFTEGKIERDYRDIDLLPGLQAELTPMYDAWKTLLSVWPDGF